MLISVSSSPLLFKEHKEFLFKKFYQDSCKIILLLLAKPFWRQLPEARHGKYRCFVCFVSAHIKVELMVSW